MPQSKKKIESRLVGLLKGSTLKDLVDESGLTIALLEIKDDELTTKKLAKLRSSDRKSYDILVRMVGTNHKDLSPQERTDWGIYIRHPGETFRAARDFPGLSPGQRYRIADSMPPDSDYMYNAALEIRGLTSRQRYMLLNHCIDQEAVLKGARDVTNLTSGQRFKLASRLTDEEAQRQAIDSILDLTTLQKYNLAERITDECTLQGIIMEHLGFTREQRFKLAMKLTDIDGVDVELISGVARFTPGLYPAQRVELIQKAIPGDNIYYSETHSHSVYEAACYAPGLSNGDRMKVFLALPDDDKVDAAKKCIALKPNDRKALLDSLSESDAHFLREQALAEIPSLPAGLYSQDS